MAHKTDCDKMRCSSRIEEEFGKRELKLEINKRKGRVLKSQSPRKEGDLIIQDRAISYIVLPEHQRLTCQCCLTSPPNLLRCSACKGPRYCNRDCQKKDWELHRMECEIIQASKGKVPTHCMLLVRLLCTNQKILKRTKEFGPFCSEIDLLGYQDCLPGHTKEMFTQITAYFTEAITARMDTSSEIIYKILEKIIGNTFCVQNEELIPFAVGLYPLVSMFNHSCTPNCVQSFSGDQVCIRSVVDIKPCEELTVSYIDLIQEVDTRRDELLKGYFFKCECTRCINEELGFQADNKQHRNILEEVTKRRENRDWSGILEISSLLNDSDESVNNRIKITEQIMDAHIELENWKEAINSGKFLEYQYSHSSLPKHFPLIALNLVKLAKLFLHLNYLNEANTYIEKAINSIRVCYGDKGFIYANLCEMYACVRVELGKIQNI